MSIPQQFDRVSVVCKANIYFDGKVVSHTVLFADGAKKTIGLIYPGCFTFNTGAPERMDIVSGSCRIRIRGDADWRTVEAGAGFDVPGNSAFDIEVAADQAEYICSFG